MADPGTEEARCHCQGKLRANALTFSQLAVKVKGWRTQDLDLPLRDPLSSWSCGTDVWHRDSSGVSRAARWNNRPAMKQQPHSSTSWAKGTAASGAPARHTGGAGTPVPPSGQRPTQNRQVRTSNVTRGCFLRALGNGRQPTPGSGKHQKRVSISEFKCGTFYLFVLIQDVSI